MSKKKTELSGNAVIYARYSSSNQRDVSIEQQFEACMKYAAENKLTIVERSLQEKGPFDFHTRTFGTWTEKEKEIWQQILMLF